MNIINQFTSETAFFIILLFIFRLIFKTRTANLTKYYSFTNLITISVKKTEVFINLHNFKELDSQDEYFKNIFSN